MTPRAWFTLFLRVIGVCSTLYGLTGLARWWFEREIDLFLPSRPVLTTRQALYATDELHWLLAGCYLLFGGGPLIRRFCAEVAGGCSKCDYDLQGIRAGAKCPECGTPKPPE